MLEFEGFPKIPRLNRDIIITEKIDGTNAQVYISEDLSPLQFNSGRTVPFLVGSRTRWILPESDNHGFARWAYLHEDLVRSLGPGRHFGEWWGAGIQRGYGLKEKRFSLFNTFLWAGQTPEGIYSVPILYQGVFDPAAIKDALDRLSSEGSVAAPGFMKPEGICIYHEAARQVFKVTLENDDRPKGA
jgi:hypothetical protein